MFGVERRRDRWPAESPMTVLRELPALVVLERIPVPVVAIAHDGTILFSNRAFAQMLGYDSEAVLSLKFDDIFHTLPLDDSAVSVVRAHADLVVDLLHMDGSTVRARMSKSALMRGDDPVALATFQDLTEQLWVDEV